MKKILTLIVLLNTLNLFSQEWTLLTPLRTTSDLRGCSFLDELHGYAVATTEGSILKTSDGGMTWRRLWTGGSGSLYDVAMVSPDTIFVCGSNGLLNRSIDGGNSWLDTNPPTGEYLYNMTFINTQVGFACGFNGVIMRTDNGGDSWTSIPSGTTNRLWDITFVNDTMGFACGYFGTILKTTDAGFTWNSIAPDTDISFQTITFVDNLVGYVAGTNNTIMKTTDGGITWTTQLTDGTYTFNYICFRSATHGWAVGTWGTFYSTTNGGTTWTSQGVLGNGSTFYCGSYKSSTAAYIMGTQYMFKSTDDGATWDMIKNGVPKSKYNSLFFWDDTTGTLAGSTGITGDASPQMGIIKTTNGGQTWDIQQQGSSNGWYGMHFPTPEVGYVIGGGAMAKTTNGGDTWSTVNSNLGLTGMAVWFLNNNVGFAGGNGLFNNICKTTNGGSAFTCGSNLAAGDFYFVNDTLGFAVFEGSSTTIFRTVDAGGTWEYIDSGSNNHSCIHFINENEGWVGGINHVMHTTDSGLTWTFQNMNNSGVPIIGIHFYTPEIGFCVSQSGTLHKTTDGGETWEIIVGNFIDMPITLNAWFTENYVYIGCKQGDVFRAELGCGEFEAGNIFGQNGWCEGEGGNLLVETIPGATYDWTFPEGWTFTPGGALVQASAGANSGLITVEITNACGLTSSSSYAVQVTPEVVQPEMITGNTTICSEGTFVFSILEDPNAEDYLWQWSSQLQATANGNELTITSASGNGYINVHTENECGSTSIIGMEVSVTTGDLPGDITSDCLVDINDLNIILANYGCLSNCGEYDLDGDGVVGMSDMIILIGWME